MSLQHSGAVRLFSPNELLHLFGFPDAYSFPASMTTRQKFRAIGQSINKIVVQMLMHSELCRYATLKGSKSGAGRPEVDTKKRGSKEEVDEGEEQQAAKKARPDDSVVVSDACCTDNND